MLTRPRTKTAANCNSLRDQMSCSLAPMALRRGGGEHMMSAVHKQRCSRAGLVAEWLVGPRACGPGDWLRHMRSNV